MNRSRADTAGSATAITKNRATNFEEAGSFEGEGYAESHSHSPTRSEDSGVYCLGHRQTENVKLIVTGEGGRAKAITGTLEKLGVAFCSPGVTDSELASGRQLPPRFPSCQTQLGV